MLKGYTTGLDAGPEMNAGLVAGPIQKMCGGGSVRGTDFGETLTSLALTLLAGFCSHRSQGNTYLVCAYLKNGSAASVTRMKEFTRSESL